MVERVEVVVDEVDLGALDAREPEAEEDVLDLAPGLGDQVDAADRLRRLAGERDVDPVLREARVELVGFELLPAGLDQGLERLAGLVGRPADGAALLGRELRHASEEVRQLGLAPEVADAELLERRARRGACDGRLGLGADRSDAVEDAHDAPTLAIRAFDAGGDDSARTSATAPGSAVLRASPVACVSAVEAGPAVAGARPRVTS